jgi:hypothetical protein
MTACRRHTPNTHRQRIYCILFGVSGYLGNDHLVSKSHLFWLSLSKQGLLIELDRSGERSRFQHRNLHNLQDVHQSRLRRH